MKILELRFKNLNSLYGEWFIDFTHHEYISNGIFALTGPTGGGKSTILDAICLALYGATPRLGKITKSNNEIMSRQTGECYAELTFESQSGRFRCHWVQHRARKNAYGNLADARHEISEADTGKPIETKKSLVTAVVEEKTGMDFDRFTRSILLAQGGFDTFLKAGAEQKSKILEQITGTEIYSEVSSAVHERQRDEREKLKLLEAETAGIIVLKPEEEEEVRKDLEDKIRQATTLSFKTTETVKAITWLKGIDKLKKEISSLHEESVKLQEEVKSFKPERDRLGYALKAMDLDGEYATLSEVRKEQERDLASLKKDETQLPEMQRSFRQKEEDLKAAEKHLFKAKEELKVTAPLIQKVRFLDQRLADQKDALYSEESSCKKETVKIGKERKRKNREQKKRDTVYKDLKAVENHLIEHVKDEWLVSGLAVVEEQLNGLVSKHKEIRKKEDEEQRATKVFKQQSEKLNLFSKKRRIRKEEFDNAVRFLEYGKKDLSSLLGDRLLREYRTEKDNLLREMALLSKIAELEDYRVKLEEGKPCPLCGAKQHPFAKGNAPVPDDTEKKINILSELIQKAEEQEAVVKKLEAAEKEAVKNLADSEKFEITVANEKSISEKRLSDVREQLKELRESYQIKKESISHDLIKHGFELDDASPVSMVNKLKTKLSEWQTKVEKKSELEKLLYNLDSELKMCDAVIETLNSSLIAKQNSKDLLKKDYESVKKERQELFGVKETEHEEVRLNKAIFDAEQNLEKVNRAYDVVKQELNAATLNITSLKERINSRVPMLIKLEAGFNSTLNSSGFASEAEFKKARLTISERNELKSQAENLDHRETDLNARKKDREKCLATEIAQKVTDEELEELAANFQKFEADMKQVQEAIAAIKHRLADNTASKERIKQRQTSIETQKKECNRWEKLHDLIGSADGKKYRNFAQGLTFDLMVSHANRQLEKMTDRYLLIRDHEQPLELNVVDNYQAGEIRSIRNLSGGETFIVSLTLALGLSKMTSRKVRVDSLFLDEGFGTLDEEALETALETLSGLQNDGKLIGIISHVSELKERISTQLNVDPVSGGKSVLSGPGCKKLAEAS